MMSKPYTVGIIHITIIILCVLHCFIRCVCVCVCTIRLCISKNVLSLSMHVCFIFYVVVVSIFFYLFFCSRRCIILLSSRIPLQIFQFPNKTFYGNGGQKRFSAPDFCCFFFLSISFFSLCFGNR